MILKVTRWSLFLLAATPFAMAGERLGDIEFFGYQGFDVAKIRAALPVHEGGEFSQQTAVSLIREAVAAAIGQQPTDVSTICCDEPGNRLLFIGLPGSSYKSFAYHPEPSSKDRLPRAIMGLYSKLDRAIESAVRKGGDAAEEDDSNGYALIKDPRARALQVAVRQWALKHEPELLRTLEFSHSAAQRRVAADALGYARQSRAQILALVRAARDSDEEVRNNATRALRVLVRSNAELGRDVQPDTFIEMLNSGSWTDRNKSASLLEQLTMSRNAELLGKIRSLALTSLIEMASWRRAGHAYFSRMVLGRVRGLPEDRLKDLAWNGPVSPLLLF